MKIDRHKINTDNLERRINAIPRQMSEYRPNDIGLLSEMAAALVLAYEYFILGTGHTSLRTPHMKEVKSYLAGLFQAQACLILKWEDRYYAYSRLQILKALRATLFHADQKDRSKKDEALRNFVFEDAVSSTLEFAITHNWLITPGLYSDRGNTDSGSPFIEAIRINDQPELHITISESLVLNVIAEFWGISMSGSYLNIHRILWRISREELVKRFGKDIGGHAFETVLWQESQLRLREQRGGEI